MNAEIIAIEKPAAPAIVAELAPLVEAARAFEVTDGTSDGEAQERVLRMRQAERAIEEHFAPAKKAASDAHKKMVAAVTSLTAPIAAARAIYFRKSEEFRAEERRKTEELERLLRDRARKEEEERILMAAIEAEENGDSASAEAIISSPVEIPAIKVAPALVAMPGLTRRTVWSAEVDDLQALVRHVASHPEWANVLLPNQVALDALARAQHEALNLPGVRAVSRTIMAAR